MGTTRSREMPVRPKTSEENEVVVRGGEESEYSSLSRLYNLNDGIVRGTYGIVYSGSEVA